MSELATRSRPAPGAVRSGADSVPPAVPAVSAVGGSSFAVPLSGWIVKPCWDSAKPYVTGAVPVLVSLTVRVKVPPSST